MHLTLEEYATVRQRSDRFFMAAGHQSEAAEDVVEEHRNYVVVEKTGDATNIESERAGE